MEKIIFFGLVISIFAFVLYLGVSAIMKGSQAKSALKEEANLKNDDSNMLLWCCALSASNHCNVLLSAKCKYSF